MPHLKTAVIITILLVIGVTLSAQPQQSKAVLYMEKINREMNVIMLRTWDYTSEVAHGKNARKAEARRKELLRVSRQAIDRVGKISDFNGSTRYRDSVISYLRLSFIVLNEDYEKILNMEEIAEQSYDQMEAYLLAQELANEKLDSAGDMLDRQQELFASENHINLMDTKDKVAKKLEKAGEVIKYYNVVFLVFFKCDKQEVYLVDAMIRKDINALEQNKNALAAMSADGLAKLDTLLPYKRDKSLVNAAKSALEFYQQEATLKMDRIIGFYMQKEKFEKILASMDAMPPAERTQEDITRYNDTVKQYNRLLADFNRLNDDLNKSRTGVLKNWNSVAQNFMDSHIPRYN